MRCPDYWEDSPMSAPSSTRSTWTAVLDQIQQSLARTLTEVEERERSFNFAAVVATAAVPPDLAPTDHLESLSCCIAAAESDAAEVENALTEAEQALRSWLTQAAAVRQTLATAGSPTV